MPIFIDGDGMNAIWNGFMHFSAECLVHAKQLLKFADQKRRSYHESVPKVKDFYKSWNGYEDELCWATAWVYKASQEAAYLR